MKTRKIKFRAWDKATKTMWFPVAIGVTEGVQGVVTELFAPLTKSNLSVDSLMQFTGLKDRNSKEIYEGDIIKTASGIGRVEMGADLDECLGMNAGWYVIYRGDWDSYDKLECVMSNEVIGNIYENSDYWASR